MKKKQLDKQLATYSAAAGAVLLGAAGAEADIHYTGTSITLDSGQGNVLLDFNQDSVSDLEFTIEQSSSSASRWASIFGLAGAEILTVPYSVSTDAATDAANIKLGSIISSGAPAWYNYGYIFSDLNGQFSSSAPGYFGVRFDDPSDGSGWLYGWAHIENIAPDLSSYDITGYAYEDSGAPIAAGAIPEADSIAFLALGAAGLRGLRRFRQRWA